VPEKVVLSVLEVLPAPVQQTTVCVVRCIAGTAVLGMEFATALPQEGEDDSFSRLTLEKIEWYGKEVEQLDTVHSGKVTLSGESVERISPGCTLTSARL